MRGKVHRSFHQSHANFMCKLPQDGLGSCLIQALCYCMYIKYIYINGIDTCLWYVRYFEFEHIVLRNTTNWPSNMTAKLLFIIFNYYLFILQMHLVFINSYCTYTGL